jgi:hypothetical protein
VASGSDPGQPDICSIKASAVKNAPRPILRQLNNGPVTMKLDQSTAIDGSPAPPGRSRGRWRQQPNNARVSQPNAAARSAHSPGQAKNLLQSDKNWRQRGGGMSGGGMRSAGSAGGSTTCFSNSQNHSPSDPNPLRTDPIPRDFFALLNCFACVMRWALPSSPAVRAAASSSDTSTGPLAFSQEFCRDAVGIGAAGHARFRRRCAVRGL